MLTAIYFDPRNPSKLQRDVTTKGQLHFYPIALKGKYQLPSKMDDISRHRLQNIDLSTCPSLPRQGLVDRSDRVPQSSLSSATLPEKPAMPVTMTGGSDNTRPRNLQSVVGLESYI